MRKLLVILAMVLTIAFSAVAQMDDMQESVLDGQIYVANVWAMPTTEDGNEGMIHLRVMNQSDVPVSPMGLDIAGVAHHRGQTESGEVTIIEPGATTAPGDLWVELSGMGEPLEPGEAISFDIGFVPLDEDENAIDEGVWLTVAAVIVEDEPVFPADIVVANVWARATITAEMAERMDMNDSGNEDADPSMDMGIPPSAAYMTIFYSGEDADSLVMVETEVAGVIEIHTTEIDGDVMRMRQVEGVDLLPDVPAILQPGGDHVMLMQLPGDLIPGEAVVLTLIFESGVEVTVGAPVRELAPGDMPMNMNTPMGDE